MEHLLWLPRPAQLLTHSVKPVKVRFPRLFEPTTYGFDEEVSAPASLARVIGLGPVVRRGGLLIATQFCGRLASCSWMLSHPSAPRRPPHPPNQKPGRFFVFPGKDELTFQHAKEQRRQGDLLALPRHE